jgi:hypothetical protein
METAIGDDDDDDRSILLTAEKKSERKKNNSQLAVESGQIILSCLLGLPDLSVFCGLTIYCEFGQGFFKFLVWDIGNKGSVRFD